MYDIEVQLVDGAVHKYPRVDNARWETGFSYITVKDANGARVEIMYPHSSVRLWIEKTVKDSEALIPHTENGKAYVLGSWMDSDVNKV